jgi:uncharacterized membrane protein
MAEPTGKRLHFVDMLRGVGLLCMVIDHAYDWWLVETENQGPWGRTTEFIGTLAAPIFLVLVGVSMALATASRRARGVSAARAATLLIQRGLIVWLWGYVTNLLVFFNGDNWPDLFAFDVLQCIGIGMMLFAPIAVWGPTWVLPLLALGLGCGGQFADRVVLPGYLGTMVNGIPPIAYFPLLPWLCFIPVGVLWGRTLARWREDRVASDRLAVGLLPVGLLAFVGAALVPSNVGYRHPNLTSILFDLAVVAWAGAMLYGWCRLPWRPKALGWLRDVGQETLVLYLVHHLVGFRLFHLLGWVTGRSWRGQYGMFGVPQATLLLIALLAGMYLAARGWIVSKKRRPAFRRIVDVLF